MLKELRERLEPYNRREMAEETGVSFCTINHIMSGYNTNPRLSTIQALGQYADKKEEEKENELSSKS